MTFGIVAEMVTMAGKWSEIRWQLVSGNNGGVSKNNRLEFDLIFVKICNLLVFDKFKSYNH